MIAACSGGAGDLIYYIQILKQLSVETIYIKENFYHPPHGNLCQTMKRIMESQGFEVLPTSGAYPLYQFDPALKFDYNLDNFRLQPRRGSRHIMERMAEHFKVKYSFKPWVENIPDSDLPKPYTIIHLTERWRDGSRVDWRKVLQSITGKIYFTGFQHEWTDFNLTAGSVEWLPTEDIYDMALLINGAYAVYCNQSIALTLAQGLGKEYWLDRKPGKRTTLMFTKNEHLL